MTRRRRLIQSAVLVLGLAGLVLTVARTVGEARAEVLPGPWAWAAAFSLSCVAVVAAGHAWAALFEKEVGGWRDRWRIAGSFYTSQLGKYLPAGGAVQAASQVNLATAMGIPLGRVGLALPVSALCTIAAGGTLGAGMALSVDLPGWARALSLLGLVTPALLYRPVMVKVLHLAARYVRRIPNSDRLPSQRSILACYAWALCNLGSFAAAYTALLMSLDVEVGPATIVCAYSISWVVGFLVLPLPAGIGIREAVLVALIPGVGTAPLVAASLAQRLCSVAAELAVISSNSVLLRLSRHPRGRARRRGGGPGG